MNGLDARDSLRVTNITDPEIYRGDARNTVTQRGGDMRTIGEMNGQVAAGHGIFPVLVNLGDVDRFPLKSNDGIAGLEIFNVDRALGSIDLDALGDAAEVRFRHQRRADKAARR